MSHNIQLKNPHLEGMPSDYLYHLAINVPDTKNTGDIQKQFGDVRVICTGGTAIRMLELAKYLGKLLGVEDTSEPVDLCAKGHRYALYKVGPVICVSHGVGSSTFSVVLHELLKLVHYAKCQDPIFLRIGTCGGIGVTPGTVVVTKDAFNGLLRNEHEIAILGERVVRPAQFPESVIKDILAYGVRPDDGFQIISANTMGTDCFYEGQGRTDGAICEYTAEDKMKFLHKCHDLGIRNIEMEASFFASITQKIGVKAGDICVTLLNRLDGDQVNAEKKEEFEHRPFLVVGRYIQQLLKK
ncbi:uridine phosphorylase 1 isoform X2 [Drosophila guanche]|uniref:uridine phosphorylase 1 isoform X2 n=1 Tax=Drosophila guanche TaxID=7266 RepID=UPI0014715DE7|nr:uridine phosphorylase 1 isoform X2 [Drosophila guanche]XP_034127432.1 uridine phosphorylase 1 isoform X2 [Drosophila guanche]